MAAAMPLQPTQQATPFVMVPRDRGDEACEQLSPIAFKIWYRITRLTCGWSRDEALISYTDFQRACGIKDRHTISKAIAELVRKGFVRVVQNLADTGRKFTSLYSLVEGSGKNPLPLVEKIHQPSAKKSTTPSGKNPLGTACGTAQEEARREAIETLIERDIERDKKDMRTSDDVTPPPSPDSSYSQEEQQVQQPSLPECDTPSEQQPAREKRPDQLLYDILCKHGLEPGTKSECARTFRYLNELTHAKPEPVTPEEFTRILAWCRKEWTRDGKPLTVTAQTISKSLTTIRAQMRASIKGANNHGTPQPSVITSPATPTKDYRRFFANKRATA